MHAEIFEIRFCQHGADHVGQSSDAQLQRCPIRYIGKDMLCDADMFLFGLGNRKFRQGIMFSFNDAVDIRNMDALIKTAVDLGQMLIDLNNDIFRLVKNSLGNARGA